MTACEIRKEVEVDEDIDMEIIEKMFQLSASAKADLLVKEVIEQIERKLLSKPK